MFATPFGLAVLGGYFGLLFALGWLGHRRRRAGSVADFYLAGNGIGFVVLLATLYASQYSGNSFLAFPGQAYRVGFAWVSSIGMMTAVVVAYLAFAPQLHELSHRHGFVTPSDWVEHRFRHRRLTTLVSVIMAVSLLSYLYAQFLAMGHLAVGMSDGRLPFWTGVVGLAVVIGVYETLGGMRSVAWTDVVQGLMLFAGLIALLFFALPELGGLGDLTRRLLVEQPALVEAPSWRQCANWASSVLLIGAAAAVYPHAIQRIYAARDAATLRRSLRVMVWLPLPTLGTVLLIGIAAHGLLPPQSGLATDRVMPEVLAALAGRHPAAAWAATIVLAAALAAIMSTADSALLSLSSILTCDLVDRRRRGARDEAALARLGKILSWVLIAVLVAFALQPPTTLWRLIEIKMELLVQVAPVFFLGVNRPDLGGAAVYRGVAAGSLLALAAILLGVEEIGGIHAGVLAAGVNVGVILLAPRARWRGDP